MAQHKGVFDISDSQGVNDSERLLMELCRKSFLSLWSHANLHTDQDMRDGKGSAKEFADVMVVFGNDVIIFSDKHITFQESNELGLAWSRWFKRAVFESAKQLHGAKKWISRHPDRIFLDPACKRPLPINLPPLEQAVFHLVAVTRGSLDACAKHYKGSLGTHQINTAVIGQDHANHPFTIGIVDSEKHFVHVWDEFSLEVVMEELNTIKDFIDYLNARANLLSDTSHEIVAAGEEQLVAAYLSNGNDEGRSFLPLLDDGSKPDIIFFDESHYDGLKQNPAYIKKRRLDEVSRFWDELIERFIRLGDPNVVHPEFQQPNSDTELALRLIASESRFRRKMLTDSLQELLLAAQDTIGRRRARVVTTRQDPELVYIFLVMPKKNEETYDDYRRHRAAMLHAYCKCAKLKFPDGERFIGLAFDHPVRDYKGNSEDLMVYTCKELSVEARAEAEKFRSELGILPDELALQEVHQSEYKAESFKLGSGEIASSNKQKNKSKKRKAKISSASRRANRRK